MVSKMFSVLFQVHVHLVGLAGQGRRAGWLRAAGKRCVAATGPTNWWVVAARSA